MNASILVGHWSRKQIQLMLDMTRLLRLHGLTIAVTVPDLYAQLLRLSATLDDPAIAQVRAQLLAVAPPELVDASAPAPDEVALPPAAEPAVAPIVSPSVAPAVVTLFPHDIHDGLLTCPTCQRDLSMPRVWPRTRRAVPLACTCGQLFQLRPNHRKFHRKPVQLMGYYVDATGDSPAGDIVVHDLSFGGLQFQTTGPHTLTLDMPLRVHFTFPDKPSHVICQVIRVRYVAGQTIGASWVETSGFDSVLALFLMQ